MEAKLKKARAVGVFSFACMIPSSRFGLTQNRTYFLILVIIGALCYFALDFTFLTKSNTLVSCPEVKSLPSGAYTCPNDFLKGVDIDKVNSAADVYLDEMLEFVGSMFSGNKPDLTYTLPRNPRDEPQNGTRYAMVAVHSPCPGKMVIGGQGDGAKVSCGIRSLEGKKCTVFSIGSQKNTKFEDDFLRIAPHCTMHTFDCTIEDKSWKPSNPKINFYPWCLGGKDEVIKGNQYYTFTNLLEKTNTRVENLILKMDIEQFEWSIFEKWRRWMDLPLQIMFELHYEIAIFPHHHTAGELGLLMAHLYR